MDKLIYTGTEIGSTVPTSYLIAEQNDIKRVYFAIWI